jgi:hypothetical protein
MYALKVKTALSTLSDFAVAIATIYRLVPARFKRYLGIFATLGAYCREHLAWGPIAIAATSVTL